MTRMMLKKREDDLEGRLEHHKEGSFILKHLQVMLSSSWFVNVLLSCTLCSLRSIIPFGSSSSAAAQQQHLIFVHVTSSSDDERRGDLIISVSSVACLQMSSHVHLSSSSSSLRRDSTWEKRDHPQLTGNHTLSTLIYQTLQNNTVMYTELLEWEEEVSNRES